MKKGNVLLGLASSGCHSNGFSLIRKIVERQGLSYADPAPWNDATTVGESLLTPTRIYVKCFGRMLEEDLIKGMAHITGGGLVENIPRMLPSTLSAELDASTWSVPPVLKWLKAKGQLANLEFATTFNTGLGMVIVVDEGDARRAMGLLQEAGETVYEVGRLVESIDGISKVVLKRMEVWLG